MSKNIYQWIVAVIFVVLSLPVYAATRYTIVTEVVPEGKSPLSEKAIVTLAGDKGRIDIVERNGKQEKGGLFLMTLDGGKTAVLGHQGKTVCSEWDSEAYFRKMGKLLHKVRRWANLEVADPKIEKVLEEPGPELLGYSTTHVRLVATANIKASVVVKKFSYSLKITDDVWIAPRLEIHPIEQQWINAQTNTGFEQLDQMVDTWYKKLPAMILKQESVIRLNDLIKKEESTKTEKIEITAIERRFTCRNVKRSTKKKWRVRPKICSWAP